ncbi:MAG: DUF1631 family protein [Pseudomonadales bacterium]
MAEAARKSKEKEDEFRENQRKSREQLFVRVTEQALKPENQESLLSTTKIVKSLNVGAWLQLPGKTGEKTECKLAVRLSGADKMIFVNREGLKLGDYSTDQLVHLIVSGEGKIIDEGIEFEDTLAAVVTKLRQDRNKSYGELTGE